MKEVNSIMSKKLSEKTIMLIDLLCYSVVSHWFSAMHNSKYRGECFTWDKFPDMMEKQCKGSLYISVSLPKSVNKKSVELYVKKRAREISEFLVKNMRE